MAGFINVGYNPLKTITRYVKKEYGKYKINSDSYTGLQNSLIKIYKKDNKSQLEEMKIEIEMLIEHSKLHNFESFVSIRYSFYALTLGLIAIIASNSKYVNQYQLSFDSLIKTVTIFLMFVFITSGYVLDKQKDNLTYWNFKLKCLNITLEQITSKDLKEEK